MRRTFSFQQSLFFNLTVGAVILGLVLLGTSVFATKRVLNAMAGELTGRAIAEMNAALSAYLEPVEEIIELCLHLARAGVFADRTPAELDSQFAPLLRSVTQISSVHLANGSGNEYMLMQQGEGYYNRVARPEERAGQVLIREWTSAVEPVKEQWLESDYDARARPWFRGALERLAQTGDQSGPIQDLVHWTDPYVFFTTRDPGITASVAYRAEDGQVHLLAFDILIRDISLFASRIQVRNSGTVFVLLRDRNQGDLVVLSVPALPGNESEEDYFPRPVSEISGPPRDYIDKVFDVPMENTARPIRFRSGGEDWWGAAARTVLSADDELWIAAVLPEDELLRGVPNTNRLVLIALVATVIFTVYRATRLARRYSLPIAAMATQSERMGRLNFSREVMVESNIREIQFLAATQDQMRRSLHRLTAMTDRSEIARELRRFRLHETVRVLGDFDIGLLDQIMPTVGGNIPAVEKLIRSPTGGWVYCQEGREPEGLALVLATTQLHGIRAGQQAEAVRAVVRALLRTGGIEPEQLVVAVRRELLEHGATVGRLSVGCAILDRTNWELSLARWGVCPTLHWRAAAGEAVWTDCDDEKRLVPATDERIFVEQLSMEPGDTFVMLSETISDLLDSNRQHFDVGDLQALVTAESDGNTATVAQLIDHSLNEFTRGAHESSDQTLFIVKRASRGDQNERSTLG